MLAGWVSWRGGAGTGTLEGSVHRCGAGGACWEGECGQGLREEGALQGAWG